MDRTRDFEKLTSTRGGERVKRYTPLDDSSSLVTKIVKMKNHLCKYGHGYLNTYELIPGASTMSEERRNRLDQDVEEFIDVCNAKIKVLQSEIWIETKSVQVIEHRKAIIEIMMRIFNDFVKCCTHLRTTRMMRDIERQKYDKIEKISAPKSFDEEMESMSTDQLDLVSLSSEDGINYKLPVIGKNVHHSSYNEEDCLQQSIIASEHHTSISPEEIQLLAVENAQIHDELVTLNDEIRMIGKKVVQITKLQELFSDKVMEQEIELNRLHETAIRSSENVREGNDLIRDAMMKNASTRVFILFYILTLGFTVLFLDWYNP